MIEMNGLCTGYGEKQILFDVCAALEVGTLVGIVGPNGCGKSTLLKTAAGLLPCQRGEILINSIPADSLSPQNHAKQIAYLSQGYRIPDMTVGQIVLHGRYPHLHFPRHYSVYDRKIAAAAMETLGIAPLADAPLSSLSGGMRQSAYLAMALAQQTDYVLLDEPTTYLDIANQLSLMRLLCRLRDSGKGLAAVMHDLPMAMSFCDALWVMKEGRIIARGTPTQIHASGVLTEVFGVALQHENGNYFYQYA